MIFDPFASVGNSLTSPAADAFAIVPDDAADLSVAPKALFVGTGGNLTVRLVDSGADVTFRNLGDGTILDIRAKAVRATGTSANDLLGLV